MIYNQSALNVAICLLINDVADKSTVVSLLEQLNSNPLNWESFVKTAHEEKLLPLLFFSCKQKTIDLLMPATVFASMQTAYINNLGRTFFLKKTLSEVLKVFNNQDVKIMLLKGGTHLVETLYPDINTRIMSDIDIMVLPEDIPRIKRIFLGLGYTCIPDPWGETIKMNFIKGNLILNSIPGRFQVDCRPYCHPRKCGKKL
jgi:hypothetical protein